LLGLIAAFSPIWFNFNLLKNKNQILLFCLCLATTTAIAQNLPPVEFIENKGQWDDRVHFKASIPGGSLFVGENGYTVLQHRDEDLRHVQELRHHLGKETGADKNYVIHSHAYRVVFEGASEKPQIIADKTLPGIRNYYLGNDRSKWATGCKSFLGITVKDIYPHIDLRYYSDHGSMKYDLIVNPGGKISDIVMLYEGTEGLQLADKMLEIKTSVGVVRELDPYTYQYGENGKRVIKNGFRIKGNKVSFDIKNYDASKPLVIDPTMIFVSFSGSPSDNFGYTATYGPDGSFFGGGTVWADQFPVTPGVIQQNWGGGAFDMGIQRLSPNGTTLMYGTFIGGRGEDQPHSLMADAQGNLVIAGRTDSTGYPLFPAAGSNIGTNGMFDIVVTMLDNTGGVIASKRIGGAQDDGVNMTPFRSRNSLQYNYGDDGRSEVIVDNGGNIYVASMTRSSNFPFTANAPQQILKGSQDGLVLKFSPNLGSLLMATSLGGSADDAAYVLDISPVTGNIYVSGGTSSTDFPQTTPGSINPTNRGGIDGFVSMFTNDLTAIIRSTYIGTSEYDQVYGVKMDRFGVPYVMGQTLSDNWPNINATFFQARGKQFIMKLNPDLTSVVYSTAFGSGGTDVNISPTAFLVDRCENVYVSGWGGYIGGNFSSSGTNGLTSTSDAYIPRNYTPARQTDGADFYFFVLKKNAVSQLYGSFFGQDGFTVDHVDGGTSRFNPDGVIYQAMCANCSGGRNIFPTTSGAFATTNPSTRCNLAMLKMAFNLSGLKSGIQSSINGEIRDTAGCVPLTVDFRDTVANAVTYEWDFDGDGVTDRTTTTSTTSWTYLVIRNYRVRMIAVDSSTCNIRDTSFMTIRVGNIETHPDFSFSRLPPCDSLRYQFTNTTFQPPIKPFRDSSFIWDFGDGSPLVRVDGRQVTHKFPAVGSYRVRLLLRDTAYCNSPEYKDTTLNIAVNVKAIMDSIPDGCQPHTVVAKHSSLGGVRFFWDFGDPASGANNFSTLSSPPPHVYNLPGMYIVKLRVVDSSTCNIVDSTSFQFNVFPKPKAVIGNATPQPPIVNTPILFTNNSSPSAVSFRWEFGDGDFLVTPSRNPVSHDYNLTKTYTVTLIATAANGCQDTARRQIETLIEQAVDVPNAFTPLQGGINNMVFVRGYGIAKIKFTIWNRWGQKVFETEDRKIGWDGKYKGVVQPMEVYAYTLDVEFADGSKAKKTGDITLIR
jgi:gliding motility-associated-like protein